MQATSNHLYLNFRYKKNLILLKAELKLQTDFCIICNSYRTRCNSLVDTYEGFGYPPGLTPDRPLRLYRSTFCRLLDLDYVGRKKTDISPEALVYEISNKSFSIGPSNRCLCEQEDECIDGVTDVSPCLSGKCHDIFYFKIVIF